jgi:hypothetical protein
MVSNDSKLATPQHGSLALWAAIFRQRMQARGWKAMDLKSKELSSRTVESYVQAEHTPRQKALRQLLKMTRQGVRSKPPLWDTDAELLDWNALLGYTGHATLDLWQNKVEGLMDGQAEIDRLIAQHHWWLDNPALQHVPRLDYFPRDLESEVRYALVALRGFRDPAWRAVLISGSERAERCGLLIHVVQDTMVHEFFRDGIYWVSAGGSLEQMFRALDEQLGSRARHSDPQTAWHTFATNPDHNALVVVEQATPMQLEALFREAGPQIRFLIEAPDLALITPLVTRWLGLERVKSLTLTGYTANEVARLVEARGLVLDEATQRRLEYARVCLRGDPVRVRAVVEMACARQPLTDESIVQHLTARGHLGAPPPLPDAAGWIARTALLREVREQLTQGMRLVILHGPPGIGKTTLVAQLRQGPALRLYFSDGIFLIPGFEGEPDAMRLSERYIEYLAATLQVPLKSTLPRAEALHRALAGQRCLLILEDGQTAAFIRHLQQILPSPTALLVTTCRSAVAEGVDRPAVIPLSCFTWEETEAYYRQRCQRYGETVSDADLAALGQLYHLTGGHPFAIYLSLVQVSAHGWARVLRFLQPPPALEAAGFQKELYRPLALAEASLEARLRERLAFLGALPLLAFYDRLTFMALWRAGTDVDETLKVLEHDAGLVQSYDLPEGERVWRLPSPVWAYARQQFEHLPADVRQEARHWRERAVQLPAFQARYREFLKTPHSVAPFRSVFRSEPLPLPVALPWWRRVLRMLWRPQAVIEWERVEANVRYFSSTEYLLAFRMCRTERLGRGYSVFHLVAMGISFGARMDITTLGWRLVSNVLALGVLTWLFSRQRHWFLLWRRARARMESVHQRER